MIVGAGNERSGVSNSRCGAPPGRRRVDRQLCRHEQPLRGERRPGHDNGTLGVSCAARVPEAAGENDDSIHARPMNCPHARSSSSSPHATHEQGRVARWRRQASIPRIPHRRTGRSLSHPAISMSAAEPRRGVRSKIKFRNGRARRHVFRPIAHIHRALMIRDTVLAETRPRGPPFSSSGLTGPRTTLPGVRTEPDFTIIYSSLPLASASAPIPRASSPWSQGQI